MSIHIGLRNSRHQRKKLAVDHVLNRARPIHEEDPFPSLNEAYKQYSWSLLGANLKFLLWRV